MLHHREGIELGVKVFGGTIQNGKNRKILTEKILTGHLIEDVGRVVTVEDWTRSLLPDSNDSFYKFLKKKRERFAINFIIKSASIECATGLSMSNM